MFEFLNFELDHINKCAIYEDGRISCEFFDKTGIILFEGRGFIL